MLYCILIELLIICNNKYMYRQIIHRYQLLESVEISQTHETVYVHKCIHTYM